MENTPVSRLIANRNEKIADRDELLIQAIKRSEVDSVDDETIAHLQIEIMDLDDQIAKFS